MKIITSFAALDLEPTDFPSELDQVSAEDYQRIYNELVDAYNEAAASTESDLYEHANPKNFLFGAFSQKAFLEAVNGWNTEIKQTFLRALKGLCPSLDEGHIPRDDELPTDCSQTYNLSGAARELDNTWYDYAAHGVYLPNELGWAYFKTLLTDKEMASILEDPSDFLIVTVYPK